MSMWIKFHGKTTHKWTGILKTAMVHTTKKKYFVYINLHSSHNVWIVAFKLININKTVKWGIMEHMPWTTFTPTPCIYTE